MLLAAATLFAMLITPVAAIAHGMGHQPALAVSGIEAGHHAGRMPGCCCGRACASRVSVHCPQCYLSPLPPMAQAQRPSSAERQPVAVAAALPTRAARNPATGPPPAASVAIAAAPRFILFGNFRC
ncbi:hypothetical protein GALL_273200 [mine drainage metagenome]|uniref:Uncharacterized protein n=1 Tax=mine drainage metagenome TaxID=410659 RepID=A0A1J5RMM7_9ZZZZ